MFGVEPRDYELRSDLATSCGGNATVYIAIHKPSGRKVAIKKFRLDQASEDEQLVHQEVILTRQLQHPNILPCITSFLNGLELLVVFPLMVYGSCRDIIIRYFPSGLPEIAIALILRDVILGLEYVHNKGYIHRGIRASHMLVDENGRVKLSGFKSAGYLVSEGQRQRALHALPPHCSHALNWLSPELLEQNLLGYNEKSDIYSLAISSCELANGTEPFSDMPITLMLTEKVRGYPPQLMDCTTCILPGNPQTEGQQTSDSGVGDSMGSANKLVFLRRKFSDSFHFLVDLCAQKEPNLRPNTTQLLTHSFFKHCRQNENLLDYLRNVETVDSNADEQEQQEGTLAAEINDLSFEIPCDWNF